MNFEWNTIKCCYGWQTGLEMRKFGNNPKGLIGVKSGLVYRWLGRDEMNLKGIEYVN